MQDLDMVAHSIQGKKTNIYNFFCIILFFRATLYSNPKHEIVVTGGTSAGQTLSSTESFDLSTQDWTSFTDLPFNMVNHGQLDLGSSRIYGGDISGAGRNLIIQYTNTTWDLATVSLPTDLTFHHAIKYPANFVKC